MPPTSTSLFREELGLIEARFMEVCTSDRPSRSPFSFSSSRVLSPSCFFTVAAEDCIRAAICFRLANPSCFFSSSRAELATLPMADTTCFNNCSVKPLSGLDVFSRGLDNNTNNTTAANPEEIISRKERLKISRLPRRDFMANSPQG